MALKGYRLKKARRYLHDVIEHKAAIPFRRFTGGVGRHSQASLYRNCASQVRWPEKSCRYLLDLLKNAEANAVAKKLNVKKLKIIHIQVQRAPKQRRRIYRAHGRINPFLRSPSHIEIILSEDRGNAVQTPKPKESPAETAKALTSK